MPSSIHPSPAIIVRADTPIGDCVRRMKRQDVGSVLVVSDDEDARLIGIFTERDLLRKADLIEQGGFWEKPVRTVMTSPVRSIPLSQLDRAPELMLRHGFRHLPIVAAQPAGQRRDCRIIGMISMRDLLRSMWEERSKDAAVPSKRSRDRAILALVSADCRMSELLESARKKLSSFEMECLDPEDVLFAKPSPRVIDTLKGYDVLILDLDGFERRTWVNLCRSLNREQGAPLTVIVFDPARLDSRSVELLEKLGTARSFAVFEKPVNILGVLERIRPALRLATRPWA